MKSIPEIKDHVARLHGFNNWQQKLEHEHRGLFEIEVLDLITERVAEKYAEQFAPKWIACSKRVPEDDKEMINKNSAGVEQTSMVLIMTETMSVYSNHRIKMQVGDLEWKWFMDIEDEKILFWTPFPESLKKLPNC